jgi:CDP-paratose 2-epimerase
MHKIEKILVTGGLGFIGVNLCGDALRKGLNVVIVDDMSRKGTDLNLIYLQSIKAGCLEIENVNIVDSKKVFSVFKKHNDLDSVIHLAGQVAVTTSMKNPVEDFEANARGTLNILEAIRVLGIDCGLLFASTNKVYGDLNGVIVHEEADAYRFNHDLLGINEQQALDFHSPYGCSKGTADQYVRDYSRVYGLKTVVLRQSCIYGCRQFGIEDQGWVAWFTISALSGMPIKLYGNGKQVRDILFVDDLIELYWGCLENIDKTSGQIFNVGGGTHRLSLLKLVSLLETVLQKKIEINHFESRPGDQRIFVSDITKVSDAINWTPRTAVELGVDKLIAWMRDHQREFKEIGIIK